MTDEIIADDKVRLREKRLADAPLDYRWQTDQELAQLDAAPPQHISYQDYLWEYSREMRYPSPSRRRFAIETAEGKHIGNCTYYNIDLAQGEAELGIMIGDRDYWSKGYGTSAVTALVDYMFGQASFKRIYLKTLQNNARAQGCFARCGFTPCGQLRLNGYHFLRMELYHDRWQQSRTGPTT